MGKIEKHTGSCHCGDVKYEVEIDASAASRCNCSICQKISQLGGMVKPPAFKLLTSEGRLSFYEWGAKLGKRYFCKSCGVHVFGKGHLEQLGGDYVSINLNTLDDIDPSEVSVTYWDGRNNNWEAGTRETPWPLKSAPTAKSATSTSAS